MKIHEIQESYWRKEILILKQSILDESTKESNLQAKYFSIFDVNTGNSCGVSVKLRMDGRTTWVLLILLQNLLKIRINVMARLPC